ncbi:MAG: pyrroloquinoline quinone biosynthesis protein PqqB [Polyangiaceae bacterium]|nr:pyrroloquinoline quinone biosynthesis protein PqqB [Polyangiaceae bacterium]
MSLVIRVLGSGAGGGIPQWNSTGAACARARKGDSASPRRGQTCLCVSADGHHWLLLDASPDLRAQIEQCVDLWPDPTHGPRHSPILGVVLTGADVDRIAGLLSLRESQPFALYATRTVLAALDENPIFDVLAYSSVPRRHLPLHRELELFGPNGEPSGILVEAYAVPGKAPLWLESRAESGDPEYTVGLRVRATRGGASFDYIPGCAEITDALRDRLRGSALLFFDGTLYRDDEMITSAAGPKTGRRMGHVSMSGPDGAMDGFADVDINRKIFIHLNNTNPALLADSPERRIIENCGWEVAWDGMEVRL